MKKAYRYDDEIVFYFDAFGNKYIAKGGSLAWRLNNPGLLLSHTLYRTGYSAIGAYHQYAIFSHLVIGKEALRAWICSTKYLDLPLIEIARYYLPSDPTKYLNQLCAMTGFSAKITPRALTAKDFDKLLKSIQQLAGFSPENEHQMALLPKITARFYSAKRKVEFYLAGYEDLLTKSQAIKWIENHSLDAVIKRLEPQERQRIHIFTLGGAAFIAPDTAHPESHNYFSIADPVPRFTSYDFCMLMLRLYEGRKIGLSQEQVIEHLIQEDIDNTQTPPQAIEKFRKERIAHYESELQRSKNITLIDEDISGFWEHTLAIPCYQAIVKEKINKYRR